MRTEHNTGASSSSRISTDNGNPNRQSRSTHKNQQAPNHKDRQTHLKNYNQKPSWARKTLWPITDIEGPSPTKKFTWPIPTGRSLERTAWWVSGTRTEAERQELRAARTTWWSGWTIAAARILACSRRLKNHT
jgi:hypothetical protein